MVYASASVLLFSETWTVHILTETFNLPGFELLARCDNPNSTTPTATGACCYVNRSMLLRREAVTTEDSVFLAEENGLVSVALVSINSTVYASVYMSPRASINLIMEDLRFIVERPHAGSKKEQILRYMLQNGLRSPFHNISTSKNGTFIDIIFTTAQVNDSVKYISFTSLHEPLYIQIPM